MQRLILLGTFAFIAALFWRDIKRRPAVSAASWLVVMWAVIFASRPVSEWFQTGTSPMTPDGYLEGSPIDRVVYLVLIGAAFVVLMWRRVSLRDLVRRNAWVMAFYAFWAVSVLWSDFPFVAFKRWFKDFGSVVMVFVLLTEGDPVDAAKAVLVRTAYLLVPLSVLFIRYIPELGRFYTGYSQNDLMYVGVATHKNTLGALLLVSVIFLVWDFATRPVDASGRRSTLARVDNLVVLCMCFWLLRIANSATSTACTVIGLALYSMLRLGNVQRKLRFVELYAVGGLALWFLLDQTLNITELIVVGLGRDMSLTTRTDAWPFLMSLDVNPLLGAGFKSFWAGDRMIRAWREFPGIVQAHNGYVETYLEGGILGLTFLAAMLATSFRKIKHHLLEGDDFARVRLTFLLVVLFYNFSEASFSQLSLLWFVTQLILIESLQPTAAAVVTAALPTGATRAAEKVVPHWKPSHAPAAEEYVARVHSQGNLDASRQRNNVGTGPYSGPSGRWR